MHARVRVVLARLPAATEICISLMVCNAACNMSAYSFLKGIWVLLSCTHVIYKKQNSFHSKSSSSLKTHAIIAAFKMLVKNICPVR